MFNFSETVKISCDYELFITAGATCRETDRTCTPNIQGEEKVWKP